MSDRAPALARLRSLVRTFSRALLGYSGGVDSACVAVVLRQELGRDRMLAVIGRSASYPVAQWEAARRVAAQFDVPLLEVETHELDDPSYRANPTNRCFFCKRELWARLTIEARARGFGVVCDGTNADDLREHRPGRAAGVQVGIRSPLSAFAQSKSTPGVTAGGVCFSSRAEGGEAIRRRQPARPGAPGPLGGGGRAAGVGAPREMGSPRGHSPDGQVPGRGRGRAGALVARGTDAGRSRRASPARRHARVRRVS